MGDDRRDTEIVVDLLTRIIEQNDRVIELLQKLQEQGDLMLRLATVRRNEGR